MVKVVLCICTCKRPVWLQGLLQAVAELDFGERLSVVVVDNHPAGAEGLAVCRRLAATSYRWPLDCVVESQQGIPFARNRAVSVALQQAPDFIAMLDDDERPCRAWLQELLRVQSKTGADVVAGPVVPEFSSATTPPWVVEGGFFAKMIRRPDAVRVHVHSTCNFIARAACFRDLLPGPFDVGWGLTGADDVMFFQNLSLRGYTMYWAANARVCETIPPSRANLRWLMQRQVRVGSTQIRMKRHFQPGLAQEMRRVVGTAGFLVLGAARLVANWSDRPSRVRGLLWICRGVGRIAGHCGIMYSEYQRIHGG